MNTIVENKIYLNADYFNFVNNRYGSEYLKPINTGCILPNHYFIVDGGDVFTVDGFKIQPYEFSNGKLYVNLTCYISMSDGSTVFDFCACAVDELVAHHFNPVPENYAYMYLKHIDGNLKNNLSSNLVWENK